MKIGITAVESASKNKASLGCVCILCVYKPKELWKENTMCISIRIAQTVTRVTDAS